MNLREFQLEARKTANYPRHKHAVMYPALGLGGEAGEVAELLWKNALLLEPLDPAKVVEELGDVLWYAASICDDLELDLEEVDCFGEAWPPTLRAPSIEELGLMLCSFAGRTQEWVKKALRKEQPFDREKISGSLSMVVSCIDAIASEVKSNLGEVADKNIEKLTKRYAEKGKAA